MPRPVAVAVTAAVAGGASLWLAHPPVGLWPASFMTVPLILVAVHVEADRADRTGQSARVLWPRGVLRLGLVAGLAAYGPMLVWLVLPAGVLGWALLVLIQAAWLGLFAIAVWPFVRSPWIVAVAPVAWTAMDAWRSVVPLGGFEWGAIAYAHVDGSWMLPLARILGGRAITLLVALIGALLFEVWRRASAERSRDETPAETVVRGPARAQPALLGLAAAVLVSVVGTIDPPPSSGTTLDLLAVQGNDIVGSADGGGLAEDRTIAERMLAQTRSAVADGGIPEVTVWPESSIDRDPYTERGSDLNRIVGEAAAAVDGQLLIGMNLRGEQPRTFRNTSVLVNADGEPLDRYVKRQLVPFGEYVPMRSLLGGLPPLQQVPRDGIPGEGPQPIVTEEARLAVVICFESMFSSLVRDSVLAHGEPAQLVVVTTNDASFGRSAEPAQHLAQSRLRAVETGRWVVHSALSGSSAFVDPSGGIHDATRLFTQTWIRRDIPLVESTTPFLVIGDVVGVGARVAGAGLLLLVLLMRGPEVLAHRGQENRP